MQHGTPVANRLLMAGLLLSLGVVAFAPRAAGQEPVTSRFKLAIGGYIKPEFVYRDKGGTGAATGNIAGGSTVVAPNGTLAGANGEFIGSTAESRFNFALTAPDWRGMKPTAFLEMDFLGAGGAVPNNPPFVFRTRHAFIRLSGEGLGGSWNLLFGRTWQVWSLAPIYSGSTLQFGAGAHMGDRSQQLRLQHSWKVFRDLTWENTIAAETERNQTEAFAEVPHGSIQSRLFYGGWQGFQGGAARPLNLAVGATVGRAKATPLNQVGGTVSTQTTRSVTNVEWAVRGGMFLPILPGRSRTDRTWALSAMGTVGYGEGIANQYAAGWTPLVNATTTCTQNAWAGASANPAAGCGGVIPTTLNAGGALPVGGNLAATTTLGGFFKPMQANPVTGAPIFTRTGTAANFTFTPAGALGAGIDAFPELQLLKSVFWDASGQFYLPWNFWLSGGIRSVHLTNSEDASPASLTIKRLWNAWGTLFWDMSSNIRWGLEYHRFGTNRRNSLFDNAENRFHLAAYFFF